MYSNFIEELLKGGINYQTGAQVERDLLNQSVIDAVYGREERQPIVAKTIEPPMLPSDDLAEKSLAELLGAQGDTGFSQRFQAAPVPNMQNHAQIGNILSLINGVQGGQEEYRDFADYGNSYIDQLIRGIL